MSKITLGQGHLLTLGQQYCQPNVNVGHTIYGYLRSYEKILAVKTRKKYMTINGKRNIPANTNTQIIQRLRESLSKPKEREDVYNGNLSLFVGH